MNSHVDEVKNRLRRVRKLQLEQPVLPHHDYISVMEAPSTGHGVDPVAIEATHQHQIYSTPTQAQNGLLVSTLVRP